MLRASFWHSIVLLVGVAVALLGSSTTAYAQSTSSSRLVSVSGKALCWGKPPLGVWTVQPCSSVTLTTNYGGVGYSQSTTPDAYLQTQGNFTFTDVPAPPAYSFDTVTFHFTADLSTGLYKAQHCTADRSANGWQIGEDNTYNVDWGNGPWWGFSICGT